MIRGTAEPKAAVEKIHTSATKISEIITKMKKKLDEEDDLETIDYTEEGKQQILKL